MCVHENLYTRETQVVVVVDGFSVLLCAWYLVLRRGIHTQVASSFLFSFSKRHQSCMRYSFPPLC